MTFNPAVVIPVYNHPEGIQALVPKLAPLGLRVVMVNDASDLPCRDVLHGLADTHGWITVVDHEVNQGKGGAVMTGLRKARALGHSHALQIDADGQHDATDIPRFLEAAKAHPDALIAGRPAYDDSVPKGRLIARYLTHVWVWIETLSLDIKDSMCGFRVYPLDVTVGILDKARLGRRMDFDPEIMVRLYWEGVPLVTLETRVIYPPDGRSHFRMWEDNWLITCMHTRLFFGMLPRLPRLIARHWHR